jgi:mannitol/fructose-specific phosphotransferase system IIA component
LIIHPDDRALFFRREEHIEAVFGALNSHSAVDSELLAAMLESLEQASSLALGSLPQDSPRFPHRRYG